MRRILQLRTLRVEYERVMRELAIQEPFFQRIEDDVGGSDPAPPGLDEDQTFVEPARVYPTRRIEGQVAGSRSARPDRDNDASSTGFRRIEGVDAQSAAAVRRHELFYAAGRYLRRRSIRKLDAHGVAKKFLAVMVGRDATVRCCRRRGRNSAAEPDGGPGEAYGGDGALRERYPAREVFRTHFHVRGIPGCDAPAGATRLKRMRLGADDGQG